MARQERLALADSRAMAKQGERQNEISDVRGGSHMIGCGNGSMGHHHGYHLGQHLGRMKGQPYAHDFIEGVMGGAMDADEFKRRSMAGGSGAYDGEGFFGDMFNGIKKVGRMAVAPVGNALGAMVGMPIAGSLASGALGAFGLGKGKKAQHMMPDGSMMDGATHGGRKHTLQDHLQHPNKGFGKSGGNACATGGKRKPSDTLQRRAKLIAKLRREEGMSMIEASKYIKAKGLKY